MMAEGLRTCAKAGWLCAAHSRWRLTAGERSSLGTYLAYPFGPAAHIPTRPLNGQETAGGGCQNGRSSPDPPLLHPLRDGGRPPCCCRGFRRALLGAAPPLDVRRPCWQPAPRPAGRNLRAAGPLAPGSELRMWELGAGLQGARAEQPDRGADREGGAEPPPSGARRASPPTRPPPAGAAVPRSCGSRRSRQPAAAAESRPLSAAGGGAAAVRGRRAPAGPPPRCRRSARCAPCPAPQL